MRNEVTQLKIGFIGTGNMATAIIKGIITKGFVEPEDVYLFDLFTEKVDKLTEDTGARKCHSNQDLIKAVDLVVLAVKPNVIEPILLDNKALLLEKKPILVSIAAGTPTEKLYGYLKTDKEIPVIRVMPNVNVQIGSGATAVCGHRFSTEKQVDYVLNMFQSIGKAWELAEEDFSNFTALAGSSPAYSYLFIDSIARAGVKHGLPKDLATEMVAQAVLGSAEMILKSKENPWTLIDQVSSPGGATVAGLFALEEEAFIATVAKGIDATIAKDQKMNES